MYYIYKTIKWAVEKFFDIKQRTELAGLQTAQRENIISLRMKWRAKNENIYMG